MKTENKDTPFEKNRYTVPAVKQAIQVLECLAASETPQMSLLNICTSVGIHKSKAYSILHTLRQFNLVKKKDKKGGYSLGPGLVSLSKRFLDNLDARSLAKPILEKLANENNCAAVFGIVEEDYVYVAEKAEAERTFSIVARAPR
jgi:DNA-binding IclR family transcriptional regulator